MSARGQELADNLAAAQDRVARACHEAGRNPHEVTMVVVTKTWPTADLRHLIDLGVRDFGESKEQEGHTKWSDISSTEAMPGLTWHFIGRIQRNKATRIASWADVIHSIDRKELLEPLARAHRPLDLLIQVSLDGDLGRGGVLPEEMLRLADAISAIGEFNLRGLMAVAPLGADPRLAFEVLAGYRAGLLAEHPTAVWLSAGMSEDLEPAIAAGATHVRLGSSILGSRY